ncbi:spermidine/putrescine import ATP-binding protein PotA [Striga asiatica]|uniref:Spermidine/putrescine import ATP-binding protein PotA n=1 Tax=Striga asiatica TaxID=4170 RepID=A0A5A7QF62_STRAF|nr:spermidine/putrescine import ATP-binding protein PotA [Striga asiatica]
MLTETSTSYRIAMETSTEEIVGISSELVYFLSREYPELLGLDERWDGGHKKASLATGGGFSVVGRKKQQQLRQPRAGSLLCSVHLRQDSLLPLSRDWGGWAEANVVSRNSI